MRGEETRESVLYTVGYEGRTLSGLVRILKQHAVRRLVDVRLQPVSRIKGFSLMALFERLRQAGITYEHMRELGNPPEIRALFHEGQIDEGRRQFRNLLENGNGLAVDVLVGLVQLEPTAILCRERDVSTCHRAVVADLAVSRSGDSLRVEHL
jgi:uncharacterized protein (DUF488 family)